jgi:curved DNA-binding protein CbpA
MDRQLDQALEVLGIPADSDHETVNSAYRRLARATHPDLSPDPDAAERFATVSAAYRLVSGVSRSLPHPRLDPEGVPPKTYFSPRRPAPSPHLDEAEDSADEGAHPASDPGDIRYLLEVPPFESARPRPRPLIVAGPVVVHSQPDPGGDWRDG